jgi:hypothetical protein
MRQQRPPCQTGHTNYQCVRCDPCPIATAAAAAPLFLYLSTELYLKKTITHACEYKRGESFRVITTVIYDSEALEERKKNMSIG